MLRLQENEVIYNNSINLGAVETLQNAGDGFVINFPDGSFIFVPEEDCTVSEREVFHAYHEFYKDTGGYPPVQEPEPVTPEPTLEQRNRADIDYLLMMTDLA